VKTTICPADGRQDLLLPGATAGIHPSSNVAFTGYLGISGITSESVTPAGDRGILHIRSAVKMTEITDGTSNTLLVGERPPSSDLYYGWWFAGAGYDGSGAGDVVMGARDVNFAASLGCSASDVGFQPGTVSRFCDQAHFWSTHSNGANFLMGDGSVRFMTYSANTVLPQMTTRSGGEVIPNF
jgi:prepilin-type processing-associated H-X9-DG protein